MHLIKQFTNGVPQSEIRVQTVEFNVRIDDALFKMPVKAEEKPKPEDKPKDKPPSKL